MEKTGFERASFAGIIPADKKVGAAKTIKSTHFDTKHISFSLPTEMKILLICLVFTLACHELANAQAPPPPDCPRGYVWCKLIFGCCQPGTCRMHLNNV